uniref:Rho guanine nucleotide exchange factor 15b n=1 Tax=Poecilia latipinna TaxID=48699 RepID=A0A3B3TX56_9TELE
QGTGAPEANAEDLLYTPLSRCCNKTCTCICHLKRPGMMLIWVPVDEDSPGGEGQTNGEERREEKDVTVQKANQIEAVQRGEQEVGGQEEEYESELPAQKKEGESNVTLFQVSVFDFDSSWQSMFEVLTSESSYLRSLYVLTEHFMENRELTDTIIISDRKTLFSNILKVREVSERFLKDLEEHIFKEIVFPDICNILHYHAQHNFSTYIDYVRNQTYQEKTYSRLMKSNEQFAAVINRLQELPQCQRLPFISFLLLPFQRITRIKMLIENILKRTKEGTPEEQTASKALTSVSKIIDCCNRDVGKMRQMEELIEISKMLEFDKFRAIPIISETRFLEKKGELQEMSKSKTFVNMRAKFSPVYLFLFNDHLLITIKKGSDRYVVMDHTHRSLVQAQPLDECFGGATYENCFNLIILENHQGRTMERLLKAPTKSDMQRWLAAFPSTTKEDVDEEVIYEDWGENSIDKQTLCVWSCSMLYGRVCVCQIVLRCSVWSSTSPSKQTNSTWNPLRSSMSSAKPTRVKTGKQCIVEIFKTSFDFFFVAWDSNIG